MQQPQKAGGLFKITYICMYRSFWLLHRYFTSHSAWLGEWIHQSCCVNVALGWGEENVRLCLGARGGCCRVCGGMKGSSERHEESRGFQMAHQLNAFLAYVWCSFIGDTVGCVTAKVTKVCGCGFLFSWYPTDHSRTLIVCVIHSSLEGIHFSWEGRVSDHWETLLLAWYFFLASLPTLWTLNIC